MSAAARTAPTTTPGSLAERVAAELRRGATTAAVADRLGLPPDVAAAVIAALTEDARGVPEGGPATCGAGPCPTASLDRTRRPLACAGCPLAPR